MSKVLMGLCIFLGILAGSNYMLYTQARRLSYTAAEYGYSMALTGASFTTVSNRINDCYLNK
jgi:hypothetical protein